MKIGFIYLNRDGSFSADLDMEAMLALKGALRHKITNVMANSRNEFTDDEIAILDECFKEIKKIYGLIKEYNAQAEAQKEETDENE